MPEMTPDQWQRVRDVVDRALELPADEQQSFIDSACGADAELCAKSHWLLQNHQRVAEIGFLERSEHDRSKRDRVRSEAASTDIELPADTGLSPEPTIDQPMTEKPGTRIGPYKLLQQIGEGGFGVVYMADQMEPVKRRVALKIIKPGMDTRQIIARFEVERQALAMMDHPNIAKVFDAGTTDLGRPYFVMELVKGMPITQFCDDRQLTPRERLELFVPVCQALQHAHQKGIIHRDIKPSNVLVAKYDDRPVPKVIDFGIVKAIEQHLTEKTMFTQFDQIVGTVDYMSPEQADLNQLDIDTRSDIYSLGVLLYELLTGETPFDRRRLHSAAFDELLRIIREEEPPKPSLRLSSSESLPSIAANRHIEPKKLSTLVRGELDWIVMKALEKDRTRRYETAYGLANDIERYLNDEAVVACPPSASYRFRKFARRNKVAFATSSVVAAALLLGLVGTTWQMFRATEAEQLAHTRYEEAESARQSEAEQRQVAEQQRADAEAQRTRADAEAERARQEAARAEQVEKYLVSAFRSPNPSIDGREIKVADILDRERERLRSGVLDDEPVVKARLLGAIGQSYLGLGLPADAVEVCEESWKLYEENLGGDHLDTVRSMGNLAKAYGAAGYPDKALSLSKEALEGARAKFGEDHADTLGYMQNLAKAYGLAGHPEKAIPLLEQALEKASSKLGEDHLDTIRFMGTLGKFYANSDNPGKAVPLLEQALEDMRGKLGEDHPEMLEANNNLAFTYRAVGEYKKAVALFEKTLKTTRTKLGEDHPLTLMFMDNLAVVYQEAGEPNKALPLMEQALDKMREKLGDDHPDTLTTMSNLASAYRESREYDKAVPLAEQVLEKTRAKLGEDHPNTLLFMNNLAAAYEAAGDRDKALPLYKQTLEKMAAKLGEDHPLTLTSMNNLALAYHKSGHLKEALPLFEQTLEKTRANLGGDHPDTLLYMSNLAVAYRDDGRLEEALPLHDEAIRRARSKLGAEHPGTRLYIHQYALTLAAAGELEKAIALGEEIGLNAEVAQWRHQLANPDGLPPEPDDSAP